MVFQKAARFAQYQIKDSSTHVSRDGSGNLVLTDSNSGSISLASIKDATELVSDGTGTGIYLNGNDFEFYSNGNLIAILDSNGNLKIKGRILKITWNQRI